MINLVIILAFIAAVCSVIMDRIAHYDNIGKGFWSQYYYHNAKYLFSIANPKIPRWFIHSFLVMFLDAWHLSKLIMLLSFFGMVACYNLQVALIGFGLYQLIFTLFYRK